MGTAMSCTVADRNRDWSSRVSWCWSRFARVVAGACVSGRSLAICALLVCCVGGCSDITGSSRPLPSGGRELGRTRPVERGAPQDTRRNLGDGMPSRGRQRLLYLTAYGRQWQLRYRSFPYPGEEMILWESPNSEGVAYFQISGDSSYVALTWLGTRPGSHFSRIWLVGPLGELPLAHTPWSRPGRPRAKEVVPGGDFAFWGEDGGLYILEVVGGGPWPDSQRRESSLYLYDRRTGKRTLVREGAALELLESAYRTPVESLRRMVQARGIPAHLTEEEAGPAVLRGIGLPLVPPLVLPRVGLPNAVAGLSPDGRYVAFAHISDNRVVVHALSGNEAGVAAVIPMSSLLKDEKVWVECLRWSPDSQQMAFTEVHFHPAWQHAFDMGGDIPDPLDWTYLVRIYSAASGEVQTLALGRNAFILP